MILEILGEYAILKTRPVPKVLAVTGNMEGRRTWLANGAGMKFVASKHNIDILVSLGDVEVVSTNTSVDINAEFESYVARKKYVEKTESFPHQVTALELMKGKKTFGLFLEQGCGKSKILIDKIGQLYCDGEITGAIVVSVKGAHTQFIKSQMVMHCGCEFSAVAWPFDTEHLPKKGLQVISFNYDALRTKAGMNIAKEFAKMHKGRLAIILDESHNIKNRTSGRHKAMLELKPYSSHRFLATGTPLSVGIIDVWSQLCWLDQNIIGINYVTTFKAEYCIMGGFGGRAIIGQKNVDRFKKLCEPYTYRVTKEDIGILPMAFDEWEVKLLPEQIKVIKEIKENLEITLKDRVIDVATAAVAISKIQQASGGFAIDENGVAHNIVTPKVNPKLNATVEWIQAGDEQKCIIWAKFRQDMKLISERLKMEGITFAEYHGGIGDKDRIDAVSGFLDPSGPQVLVANPQSAGVGLNLQGLCTRALFYSNSFNYFEREQAAARIHRIGTFGIVTNTDLIAKGSVDRHILNNLKKKTGLSELVFSAVYQLGN